MPVMITKNGKSSTFVYGPEHQRTRQMREDGTAIIYAGNQELEFTATAAIKTIKTYGRWALVSRSTTFSKGQPYSTGYTRTVSVARLPSVKQTAR